MEVIHLLKQAPHLLSMLTNIKALYLEVSIFMNRLMSNCHSILIFQVLLAHFLRAHWSHQLEQVQIKEH